MISHECDGMIGHLIGLPWTSEAELCEAMADDYRAGLAQWANHGWLGNLCIALMLAGF